MIRYVSRMIDSLSRWATDWGMRFNTQKCYSMSIHRNNKPRIHLYSLANQFLEQVTENPYLGVLLSTNLSWSNHISNICKRANSTLGCIRRNLKTCNTPIKKNSIHCTCKIYSGLCIPRLGPPSQKGY